MSRGLHVAPSHVLNCQTETCTLGSLGGLFDEFENPRVGCRIRPTVTRVGEREGPNQARAENLGSLKRTLKQIPLLSQCLCATFGIALR